ncbi:MAG: FtsQ-type POTRA domain-containing protein [Kiritimatiellae bacterium]|nr:FtsQ-type POTRA domain-containing protein [Kiritimatiellia bacterium]
MLFFRKKDKRVNVRRNRARGSALQVSARAKTKGRAGVNKVGAVVLILAVLVGIVWASMFGISRAGDRLFAENDRFVIQQIEVTSTGTLSSAHLRQYARVSEGQNLFAVNISQIVRNLERTPRVRRAEVRRKLPDTLVINVQERTPIALIKEGAYGRPMPVDGDGHILDPNVGRGLPLISGGSESGVAPGSVIRDEKTLDALRTLDLSGQARLNALLKIESIKVGNPDYLELRLTSGARVDMGRDRLKWRLEKLADLVVTHQEFDQEIEYADLTVDKNFPVRSRAAMEARAR